MNDPRIGDRELVQVERDGALVTKHYRNRARRVGFADIRGEDRRCLCGFALWDWQRQCPRCGRLTLA